MKKNKNLKKPKHCNCLGTSHDVYSNCTNCGYIVCWYIGEGPCAYCGAIVHKNGSKPKDNMDVNNNEIKNNRKHSSFYNKNTIVVIDDQGDFYIEKEKNDNSGRKKQIKPIHINTPSTSKQFDSKIFNDNATNIYNDLINLHTDDENYKSFLVIDQPFSSLIVKGIINTKVVDKNIFYRKNVWIISSPNKIHIKKIKKIEKLFTTSIKYPTNNSDIIFPKKYERGCIIGNAKISDCINLKEEQIIKREKEINFIIGDKALNKDLKNSFLIKFSEPKYLIKPYEIDVDNIERSLSKNYFVNELRCKLYEAIIK